MTAATASPNLVETKAIRGARSMDWLRLFTRNLLICGFGLAAFFLIYMIVWERFERLRLEGVAARTVAEHSQSIRNVLGSAGNDLSFLARMPALQRFLTNYSDQETRSEIEAIFEETALENANADRLTFLDRAGKEQIRVERAWEDAWITPQRLLQERADEAYFAQAMQFAPNTLHLTPLEFDREHGRIIEPRRLVMHAVITIGDASGNAAGAIAMTIKGRDITASFDRRDTAQDSPALLDGKGGVIAGNLQTDADGGTIATPYPDTWKEIGDTAAGQVWQGDNLYRFATIYPTRDAQPHRRATTFGAVVRQEVDPWKIVSIARIDKFAIVTKPENLALIIILTLSAIFISWGAANAQHAKRVAERRAQRLDRRMRDILNNIQASVQVRDLEGRFVMVNRALTRQTGVSEAQILGSKLRDVFGDTTAEVAENIDSLAWHGRDSMEPREVTYPSKNTYLVNSFLLHDENGHPDAVCTTAVDITQLKAFERELIAAQQAADEANKAKSRFLASMSHEFRTPMNAIIGYSEMLAEDAAASGQTAYVEDLNRILLASRHLLSLINGVLDLSKIEAGRMELFIEEFKFDDFINDVVATVGPLAEKNGNQFVLNCGEVSRSIHNDATRLRQIVLNLISNAAKFTKNGTITLETVVERVHGMDWLRISVSDTGIGMTQEQLGLLFEDFSQAHTESTKAGEGTGLGLTISKSLARMMMGDITVESEIGTGSRFVLSVPCDVSGEAFVVATGKSPMPANQDAVQGRPVLVIDDEANAREIISRFLTREGFRVVTASGGEEGIARARQLKPIAITLDVFLKDSNGWDILQRIGEDPALRHIPVIMCTIADERGRSLSLGAVDCLVKPIRRETLLPAISAAVSARQSPFTVMAIDDEDVNRRQFARYLSDAGHTTIHAENGLSALRKLEDGARVDAILLDLVMPVMDGFQFLREIRNGARWNDIPIIVVTSKSLNSSERMELELRAQSIVERNGRDLGEVLESVKVQILAQANRRDEISPDRSAMAVP